MSQAPVLNPSRSDPVVVGILLARAILAGIALFLLSVLLGFVDLTPILRAETSAAILQLSVQLGHLASVALLVELPVWLQTMGRNLQRLGVPGGPEPQRVLRSFLVPGKNLVIPYQFAQRIWRLSRSSTVGTRSSLAISTAWASWLCVGALWLVNMWLIWFQSDAGVIGDTMVSLLLVQQIAGLVASLSTLQVVSETEGRQRISWVETGREVEDLVPPYRHLGPRHGVLAVLVGLGASRVAIFRSAQFVEPSLVSGLILTQLCLAACTLIIFRHPDWARFGSSLLRRAAGPAAWRWGLSALLLGGGLAATVRALLTHPLSGYRRALESMMKELMETNSQGGLPPMVVILLTVVLAPIVEEVLFRGLVLPTFRLRWDPAPAVLATALLFAFVHSNPLQMAAAFCLGTACGVVRLAARSIWPAVVLHALYNLLVSLPLPGGESAEIPLWSLPAGLLAAGIGLTLALWWRPLDHNPLLHARWWWGRARVDTALQVAEKIEQATAPAARSIRGGAGASLQAARRAQQRSTQAAVRVTSRLSRQGAETGVQIGRWTLHHPTLVAAVFLVAGALFNFYWLLFRMAQGWEAVGSRARASDLLLIDLARFGVSSLAVAAFAAWVVNATSRAMSSHSADSQLREFLPALDERTAIELLRSQLRAPRTTLGTLWNAATSDVTHWHSKASLRLADGRLPILFWTLAVSSLLALPAVLLQSKWTGLLLTFRWTLGSVLALILILRAGRFLFGVESALRVRREDLQTVTRVDQRLEEGK